MAQGWLSLRGKEGVEKEWEALVARQAQTAVGGGGGGRKRNEKGAQKKNFLSSLFFSATSLARHTERGKSLTSFSLLFLDHPRELPCYRFPKQKPIISLFPSTSRPPGCDELDREGDRPASQHRPPPPLRRHHLRHHRTGVLLGRPKQDVLQAGEPRCSTVHTFSKCFAVFLNAASR